MQYLGGKSLLAKTIANHINPRGYWWDPFCGGLYVSTELSKIFPRGLVSDICIPLLSLYSAVRDGWIPPDIVTRQDYSRAKMLPDSDPLKAFIGFGCSFGGKWFGGYCGPRTVVSRTHPNGMKMNPIRATKNRLFKDLKILDKCDLLSLSFFDISPSYGLFESIYCDPPYKGVTGYSSVSEVFDYPKFWSLCSQWSKFSRVFVSEINDRPVQHNIIYRKSYGGRVGYDGHKKDIKTELLFQIL